MNSWGAIFDWDGVIVDSSAAHEESWERLAREEARPLPEGHFKRGFGMKNERIIPELLGWTNDPAEIHRLSLRKEELYRVIVSDRGIEALPGVRNLLDGLHAASVPCVVGSSTHRINITMALDYLKLADRFRAIVTAEDVTKGKPDPEVFLKSAAAIGCTPERCVVFEDVPAGIRAGRAAGMRVVAVATTHPRESLKEADRVVDRLTEVRVPDLAAWFASEDRASAGTSPKLHTGAS